jgi:RNA polymerase sigma-70 factor (ECF subfamily)
MSAGADYRLNQTDDRPGQESDGAWRTEPVQRAWERFVRRQVQAVCPAEAAAADFPWEKFSQRLEACLGEHGSPSAGGASNVIEPLERCADALADNLRALVLAQALELQLPSAAETFEQQWMPLVRATARRVTGPSGAELVENFVAELILPRKDAPPRIARYRGRTPFAAWLRVVVTNHCLSQLRRRRHSAPLVELADETPPASHDHRPCRELLLPLVRRALSALGSEDRLLLKLLVLDEVPQQEVARLLGVHSGNVTRRRQRAAETVWRALAAEVHRAGKHQAATDCLELVLTGQDAALRSELSRQLALACQSEEEGMR